MKLQGLSQLKLNTRVFELYKGKYRSLPELAWTMEIPTGQIYKVKTRHKIAY